MNTMDNCERCEGSGADPVQSIFDDEFSLCRDCSGDGHVLSFDGRIEQLADEPLRLSA